MKQLNIVPSVIETFGASSSDIFTIGWIGMASGFSTSEHILQKSITTISFREFYFDCGILQAVAVADESMQMEYYKLLNIFL